MAKITIDKVTVEVADNTTILEAAKAANIKIPTLCYLEKQHAPGACRVCVVEVAGAKNLMPACVTPVRDGMQVSTKTPGCATPGGPLWSSFSRTTTATARPASGTAPANCRPWPKVWGSPL
jgi:ferredoxin